MEIKHYRHGQQFKTIDFLVLPYQITLFFKFYSEPQLWKYKLLSETEMV